MEPIIIAKEHLVETTELFTSGRDGYRSYRIPALVVTSTGTA